MTTLTDTNDPDVWAAEFCRLFEIDFKDIIVVSNWLKAAMDTAIKLNTPPESRPAPVVPEVSTEKLYATKDAAVWTDEFMKVVESGVTVDWGLMVGWFANCAETAYRIGREAVTNPDPAVEVIFTAGEMLSGVVDGLEGRAAGHIRSAVHLIAEAVKEL